MSNAEPDTPRPETLLNVISSDKLKPGIYKIVNYELPNLVIDLSGADNKTVIGELSLFQCYPHPYFHLAAFSEHGWANQQVIENIPPNPQELTMRPVGVRSFRGGILYSQHTQWSIFNS